MEILERIWDVLNAVFGGLASGIERAITSMFGSSNARYLKKLQPRVDQINALESKYEALSDEELRAQTEVFRQRLREGESLDDILPEAFAVCREGGRRYLNMRHYDVQLMGGMILHNGAIAEMVTGEGKTLVATLPAYLNALTGRGVHVVTVNDYLARRDMEWMGKLYIALGLTVGAIYADMDPAERQRAYQCDITYGTNNEFGFDYLRDNMKPAAYGDDDFDPRFQQVQRELHYAIVDEVDNILIDEARTPLIISGPAHDDVTKYRKADDIARQLKRDAHFEVKEKEHTAHMTDDGVRAAEKIAGVESFYTAGNMEWPHLIDNSLKAHYLYKRDVNYVVQDGEVIIVDEFTGRLMPGRNWSDGLHQAVEAKEGVRIKEENQTLATITLQNFFKLYDKISGMTGTAMTEAGEFWKIYQLDVIAAPTNRELQRINYSDVIYCTEKEKFEAIADEIERLHKWDIVELNDGRELIGTISQEDDEGVTFKPKQEKSGEQIQKSEIRDIHRSGRPVLVGTVSIEKSERLGRLLERRGIPHQVLNAKHHKREAEIVAQAGRKAAVTIATNMAGRGTDIILGGNPDTMAWAQLQETYATRLDVPPEEWEALVHEIQERENMIPNGQEVKSIGGLHCIGTERHESRRIDNQLRGRAGRQGDPGSSRFFLSLEDDLMRIFAGEWVKGVLQKLGMQEGEAIESRMVSRRIEGAQKKVEEKNFETRKHLLEYDEVMDEQRKRVYGYRQRILHGANCKKLIMEMINQQLDEHLEEYLDRDYGTATFCKWIGSRLGVEGLEPKDFRSLDFEAAERYAKDEAEPIIEGDVHAAIEENLSFDEDPSEWKWAALAKFCNVRWNLSIRDADLKKIAQGEGDPEDIRRDDVADFLIDKAVSSMRKEDCSDGAALLEPDFGMRNACSWVERKFDFKLDWDQVKDLEPAAFRELIFERAVAAYEKKEVEYPVMAGMLRCSTRDAAGSRRVNRELLIDWAAREFGSSFNPEDLKNKQRDEIESLLMENSRQKQQRCREALDDVEHRIEKLFSGSDPNASLRDASGSNGAIQSLTDWLKQTLNYQVAPEQLEEMDREQLQERLTMAVENHYRRKIRRDERRLLLQILDTAWKDHLLAMDHLRASVGLRGYAQVDPKVEYKREGMRIFEDMWSSVGQQVTDIIFRIEQLDEDFVASTWADAKAQHQEAPTVSDIAQQQQAAMDGMQQSERKPEPIRNRQVRVGRNDPCPCNSGKKFKNCCMKNRTPV